MEALYCMVRYHRSFRWLWVEASLAVDRYYGCLRWIGMEKMWSWIIK
jgi:hypothetical protein